MRSRRPSPFTSTAATEDADPVVKLLAGAKLGEIEPGVVVLSSTETSPDVAFATRRSGRPSPFTSAAAMENGPVPAAKLVGAVKFMVAVPVAAVFSSTDTSLELAL